MHWDNARNPLLGSPPRLNEWDLLPGPHQAKQEHTFSRWYEEEQLEASQPLIKTPYSAVKELKNVADQHEK